MTKTGNILRIKQTKVIPKQTEVVPNSQPTASQQTVFKIHLDPRYNVFHWGSTILRISNIFSKYFPRNSSMSHEQKSSKSMVTQPYIQQLVRAHTRKLFITDHLSGVSTDDQWICLTKGLPSKQFRKLFHVMILSCDTMILAMSRAAGNITLPQEISKRTYNKCPLVGLYNLWPLLLTRINFNPTMDK